MITNEYMKEIGIIKSKMVLDSKDFLMNVLIKENIPMVSLKELVVIHGLMDNFIKDNGYLE